MGPGTGQKLRPLESKEVSLSVSWWLERLTTVWELLLIIRDFQRENRERFWIKELRVLHPDGIKLNLCEDGMS